ncbi:hypothetical protein [Parvibaculum sp.]|uniref:hypothetical protein n=1 Tax=Parvibaculum sp. TaxID=2024848 RepID=UPI001DF08740|nr:hypothetical protein [Parvibaculum sp.]MBX3489271.1 hypothetical protein [Parvibaculum sp.]MCW5726868.1 hypothetical protein [Parvibaculum sp.]
MEKDMEHTEHPPVSRRNVVILGGTALVAAAVPAALFHRKPKGLALDTDVFMRLLADPAAAAKLGEIRFAESKPGLTRAVYETRLARRLRAHGWSPAASPELARRALAASVRADYLGDRMVAIEKWHLSETEADLCALAALVVRAQEHPV